MAPTFDPTTPVGGAFQIRSRRTVALGPVTLDIRSNEPDFRGFRFFSQPSGRTGVGPDFTLSLCKLSRDTPWGLRDLSEIRDKNYRAQRMSAGYYLTDHFGGPAYLVTRGRHYWIFAEDFESILWPYAVKYLLTAYSMDHDLLHLKAAAVALNGHGALLVGRGGSGKTVLLTQLCGAGAQYLSNTHVLLREQELLGITTTMRVRADKFFAPMIAQRALSPSVQADEYIADPVADLGWKTAQSAPVRMLCLVDYNGPGRGVIRAMGRESLFNYLEHFALALNVYGLKEDVLDYLGGDVERFSVQMALMKHRLRALVEAVDGYYVGCDAADPRNLQKVLGLMKE